ncbi:biotin-dependent carboxyltransferase family protein [Paenibacillus apii]|uniref:5-oxoprolinase subunit C family protein n=1 Tax=Paenibacillus apii TaxID=1850370 RepID=UPI0014394204|nr:biotin-dependent carboxyltransferase family protein [Paenibacillus apii]NJJ41944.1 biotin-dependent carboxyltransferase family protein [Paenibacillus apii]
MEFVKVVKPGFFTTVQDLGRRQYQNLGISTSGAMDGLSLRLANLLVGNDEEDAALEATLIGPKLRFAADAVIAITGGDLSPALNGIPVPMWKSIRVRQDDELSFGNCVVGCRAYISIAGGIEVPPIMGSRSTYFRGHYGGHEGRALKIGDEIPIGNCRFNLYDIEGRRLQPGAIPDYRTDRPIRFIPGPQADAFTQESFEWFTSRPYDVTNESDRMGYRLQGQQLEHVNGADIISDFITVGSIQVPAIGQPIILMADCQTTGGYTKIGVVISVDLPYVAQKKPRDQIRFEAVDVTYAQELYAKREKMISGLKLLNRMLLV